MAAKKFLRLVAGRFTEIVGIIVSAGAGNDGDIPALDATGRLDTTVMPVGFTVDTVAATATEAISSGAFVNLWLNGGILSVRNADATTSGKEANGFVLAAVSNGAVGTVYQDDTNTGLSALTIGSTYYLSTTPGVASASPPSGSGNVVQALGRALSTTSMHFQPTDGVILA